jgi:hypothetical protein
VRIGCWFMVGRARNFVVLQNPDGNLFRIRKKDG